MKYIVLVSILATAIQFNAAQAQTRPASDDQVKAYLDFAIAASFHDDVIRSIQEQCPTYKAQVPFNDTVVSDAKKINSEMGKLLTEITNGAKPLAKAHAAQIVANADGCDSEAFKKSIAVAEEHQAMLVMRAMQGRLK